MGLKKVTLELCHVRLVRICISLGLKYRGLDLDVEKWKEIEGKFLKIGIDLIFSHIILI